MKITPKELRQIIKEEYEQVISEGSYLQAKPPHRWVTALRYCKKYGCCGAVFFPSTCFVQVGYILFLDLLEIDLRNDFLEQFLLPFSMMERA